MSRLVVKNLPTKVTEDQLRSKFSEVGTVTDVQLKYTKNGKFRQFAFVGFSNDSEATAAMDYFNKSYLDSHRLTIEKCIPLGDDSKPKALSKYTVKEERDKLKTKKPEEKPKVVKDNARSTVCDLLKSRKDNSEFLEYLDSHGVKNVVLEKIKNIELDSTNIKGSEVNDASEDKKIVEDTNISDFDYLKLKAGKKTVDEIVSREKVEKSQFITVVLRGLPCKVKKGNIKNFFKPLKLYSVRIPRGIKGVAYVGFKTEDEVQKALNKNKSFVEGRQIFLHRLAAACENNSEYNAKNSKDKWKKQEESLQHEEDIAESGRLFVRNLPYTTNEDALQSIFEKYGPVTEVIVPIDKLTRQIKGYAVVTFLMPEHAVKAYTELDGTIFQGRMLHLLPGKAKTEQTEEGGSALGSSYKKTKANKMKSEATSTHNWNTLFLGQNAVANVMAETYNTTKQEVLTGDSAAVRLALGETQLVNQTKDFLMKNGVQLDEFNNVAKQRSKTIILVKNLPENTDSDELRNLFAKFGPLKRLLLPPSGVTAIVQFEDSGEAKMAFRRLAYSKFKHLPLYLEWAPESTFASNTVTNGNDIEDNKSGEMIEISEKENASDEPEPDTTLFIKNLNFDTTEESIKEHFKSCGSIANVTIAKKKDPSKPNVTLSMGYGFIQFYKCEALNKALKTLQMSQLDGHNIELKRSNRTMKKDVITRKTNNVSDQTGTKIIVRNIPFQAQYNELIQLFKTFGEIKALRLPKKMVGTGSHRGFAFVEYCTQYDAKRAMESLCQSTHLYGRRLVLEWAQADENVDELRKRTAKHFCSDDVGKAKHKKATADIDIRSDEE